MVRARWAASGCWALALCASAPAKAEVVPAAPPPTYALSWVRAEGAEECPTGRALATEVERRLGRAVFDATAERSFEVEVTRLGKRYRSDVYVRDVAGHTIGHRSLESDEPGCSALVNATALAIALVIDPEAAAREPAPSQSVAAFEPAVAEAKVEAPPAAPSAVPLPPSPSAPARVELRLPTPAPATVVTASARAQITGGLVAGTSPGLELSFSARPSERWGVAVAGSYTLSQTATRGIGSLELSLTRVSALATFDAGRSERVRVVLGAGPTVGAFHVAVRRPSPVTSPGDYWFVAGQLLADVQLSITKSFFVELGASGLVPFGRQTFAVRGQAEPVFSQPPVSGLGFFGVGAQFP
ncbi:MAG: hypothetical protein ABUL60_22930 [Myxococcales bacterium]